MIIHAGSVLGSDGFGYRWDGQSHVKIPQIGADIAAMFALLAEKMEAVSLMELEQARIKRQIATIIEANRFITLPACGPAASCHTLVTSEGTTSIAAASAGCSWPVRRSRRNLGATTVGEALA